MLTFELKNEGVEGKIVLHTKTTDRLLAAASDIWKEYLKHPFVVGMADGSLDVEKFRFYMLQDYLYLFDYAKVFAYGVIKAQHPDSMRIFAANVEQILHGEMSIHKGYMKRLGISEVQAEGVRLSLKNQAYTAYMRTVAAEGGTAEIMAAVLSCALSYEYIAQWMVQQYPASVRHEFYGEWVSGYASEEYAAGNRMLTQHMEQLTRDYTEAQISHLEEIFVACSRHEGLFWEMAWNMEY